jgi:CelD/BcsL family acetyltransferase involved in cellulose biosynthesis
MQSGQAAGHRFQRVISSVHGRGGFDQLTDRWEALIAGMQRVRFMQHPDWYRAMFDAALENAEAYVFITVSEGPFLVGLFPLHSDKVQRFGATINTIGLCRHPHMVLTDCILDNAEAYRNLPAELIDWLHREEPVAWDVLMMKKVPERSSLYDLLSAEPADRVMPVVTSASAYVPTPNEEAVFSSISTSFKRNLRRLAKRAEESAPLRYEVCDTFPDIERAYQQFLEVEASGWKGVGGTGSAIAEDAKLVNFYRILMQRFGARGQCKIMRLSHGDRVVASQFGLLVGGTFNILKIGYREDFASFAPGNLIMERTLRWCCCRPDVNEMSFVTCPVWAHLWKPQQETVTSFRIFRPSIKGRLLCRGLRAKCWYDQRRGQPLASESPTVPQPAEPTEEPETPTGGKSRPPKGHAPSPTAPSGRS